MGDGSQADPGSAAGVQCSSIVEAVATSPPPEASTKELTLLLSLSSDRLFDLKFDSIVRVGRSLGSMCESKAEKVVA